MFGYIDGRAWTPRRQGDFGELSAMEWLVSAGAIVSQPLFANPDYDLIADFEGELVRVQVKTSTCWRNGRYEVTLATRGGNQSWSGVLRFSTGRGATACSFTWVTGGAGTSLPGLSEASPGSGSVARNTRNSRSNRAHRCRRGSPRD
jgi:hypothetical protein